MQLDLTKAKAERARRSLYHFVQEFWSEIIPEDPVWNWHIEFLCDQIQQEFYRAMKLPGKPRQPKLHDTIINIPPGTSKSTIVTVMAPAWAWTNDPTLRILTASYSGDLATDHAVKSRDIIQSAKYKAFFPEVEIRSDQNNKTNYKNTALGERYATSVGGTVTGFHAHIILVDDPINAKQASSMVDLESASNFMDTTLSTRKVNKEVTPTILVMQRLHDKDPTGNWLAKKDKKIKHICLPAELSDLVKPESVRDKYIDGLLDPIRMNRTVLAQSKQDLGTYGYSGQMGQNPSPEGGGVWQRWFIPVPDKDFPEPWELEGYGTDVDSAYTDKTTNAASAFVTSGRKGNKVYVDNVGWFWKEFPDLINMLKTIPSPHYVEAKASGKSLVQTLIVAGVPAFEVDVPGDKMMRARSVTPKAEAGMVFVRESILEKIYTDPQQGILKFPNSAKLDLADALAQAIWRHLGKPAKEVWFGWG